MPGEQGISDVARKSRHARPTGQARGLHTPRLFDPDRGPVPGAGFAAGL